MASQINLNTLVFSYIQQSVLNGNTDELNKLGLNTDDAMLLRRYPITNVNNIFTNKSKNLIKRFELDNEVLSAVITKLKNGIEENELIERLIASGGTYSMLNHFFGIRRNDFSSRRRLLCISSRGRSNYSSINEREIILLVNTYIKKMGKNYCNNTFHQCNALLYGFQNTTASLETIWKVVDNAERRCLFSWTR